MERTIITARDLPDWTASRSRAATGTRARQRQPIQKPPISGGSETIDDYASRLVKYMPTESVALYLALDGLIRSSTRGRTEQVWLGVTLAFVLVFTPLYMRRIANIRKPVQIVIGTLALVVWVFAAGGVFATFTWYEAWHGSFALIAVSSLVPLISPDGLG